MFKSRSGSQGHAPTPAAPSIDELRRRARHRLIGAAVLVALGVVGFPLLFDTAPRPLTADVPIDIPSRGVSSLPARKPAAAADVPSNTGPSASAPVPVAEALDPRETVVTPEDKPATTASDTAAVATAPATSKQEVTKADAAKADKPKADAKESAKPAEGQERIIVQVGAFADAQRAREVRLKLERAGLKTYTHVAETSEGKRIRVRLGPFSTRAEAEKAAAKAKSLGLQAAILTL